MELAAANDLEFVAIAPFFTHCTGELLRPLNDSVKQAYKAGAVAFAGNQDAPQPFTTMGLLGKDDSTSPTWEAWLKP